jgi:hypothetical protein
MLMSAKRLSLRNRKHQQEVGECCSHKQVCCGCPTKIPPQVEWTRPVIVLETVKDKYAALNTNASTNMTIPFPLTFPNATNASQIDIHFLLLP